MKTVTRYIIYFILIALVVFSLFPFFVLLVNATRLHSEIQKGFSALPGLAFGQNLKNLMSNDTCFVQQRLCFINVCNSHDILLNNDCLRHLHVQL